MKERFHALRIADSSECFSKERIWVIMNDIHILKDHLIHTARTGRSSKKKQYPDGLEERISGLLSISRGLYELLEEFQDTMKAAEYNKMARLLGTGSDLASLFEEFITGEDPLNDVLMNAVPFVLARLEETAYIKSAEEGFRTLFQMHTLDLYERFWKLAHERPLGKSGYSYEDSKELGKGMDALRKMLSDRNLDRPTRFILHVILYMAVYNREIAAIEEEL